MSKQSSKGSTAIVIGAAIVLVMGMLDSVRYWSSFDLSMSPEASATAYDESDADRKQGASTSKTATGKKSDWPFSDSRDKEVFVTDAIVRDNNPVLFVSHDRHGEWQFRHTAEEVNEGTVLELGEIATKDPSLLELYDLPRGWQARRESEDAKWQMSKN